MKKCLFNNLFKTKEENEKKYFQDNNKSETNKPIIKLCIWPDRDIYIDPFDKDLFFDSQIVLQKRHAFLLYYNQDDVIPLANIQTQDGPPRYYLTAVNVEEYCRKIGITNLLYSWVILKLMEDNKEQDFSIYIDLGREIQNIRYEKSKFIYYKVFDENRISYTNSECTVDREFPLECREVDRDYFLKLYKEVEKSVVNNCDIIKQKKTQYEVL